MDDVKNLFLREAQMGYLTEPHKILEGWTHFTKDQVQLLFTSTQCAFVFELPIEQRCYKLRGLVGFSGGYSLDIAGLILLNDR